MTWGVAIGIIGTILFMAIPGSLLKLFNASEETLAIGIPAVRIMCVTFALCLVTTILGMCASGLGNGVMNMMGTGIRQVILLLPCFFVLLKTLGLPGAWFFVCISEITAVLYVLRAMKRETQKKSYQLRIKALEESFEYGTDLSQLR